MVSSSSFVVALLAWVSLAQAATHTFNWTTGWGTHNVDGNKERPVITCNGEFPWPNIKVQKGDRIQVYLKNGFDDRNTSLHFHGLFQNGTSMMDGPEMITQCPIAPGDTMLYNFTVDDNVGTYWYHSHTAGQYQDGMKGTLVIEDTKPYPYDYDEEVVVQLAEWYHDVVDVLDKKFMSVYNPTGAEPIPQNLIINNTRNLTWEVQPDTTYLLRIVNTGGFVSQYFWIEDHDLEVVEVDGIMVEKNTTSMIYITVAQRYTVLVHTKNDTSKNFAIMQKFDDTMLDKIPKDLELNATSYMIYNNDADKPKENFVDSLDDFLDDYYLTPLDKVELYDDPDYTVTVDVVMDNLKNGINYAFFNNITYTAPKVPVLMTALSAGKDAVNSLVYGTNTNSFVLKKDEIVEIILNNNDTGKHPFHLHGHAFQVINRDRPYDDAIGEGPTPFDPEHHAPFPEYPMIRDTVYVNPQSNMVLRFKADNPGVWFFHCHIEWHLKQGLALVFVEAPEEIQQTASQQLTDNHKNVCKNVGLEYVGNAAGNKDDFLNLKGENVQHKNVPKGFTKRGIVAMFFTCLSGVLGLIVLSIYGLMGMGKDEEEFIKDLGLNPEVVEKVEVGEIVTDEESSEPSKHN